MRDDRIARSVASTLIILPLAMIVLYMIFGLAFAQAVFLYGLGCTAVGIAASALLGRRNAAWQILASALPAAALAFLVPVSLPGVLLTHCILAGAGTLLAIWSERLSVTASSQDLKPGLLLAPLLVLLAASTFLWFNSQSDTAGPDSGRLMGLLLTLALLWTAVSVFLLNRLSARHASRADAYRDVPAGVRRFGAAGVAVFLAAALLLGSIGAISSWLGSAFKKLALWVMQALLFIGSLFGSNEETGEQGAPPSSDMGLPEADGNASPLMELITNIIIVVVLVAVALALLYGLYRLLPKLWKKLRQHMDNLFASWREEDSYHDKSESLLSLRQALADAGASLRKLTRRFRRKPRYTDCHTNADRARFLFRHWLHSLVAAGQTPQASATATDIARTAPPLAQAYNLARYGEGEPSDEEIAKAKEAVKIKD